MKEKKVYINIGIGIYAIMALIDRFVCKVPNMIYIPIIIVGIVFIMIGFYKDARGS